MLFLALAAALTLQPPADAIVTPDGVSMQVLVPGTGTAHPESSDYVRMHYTIYSVEGKKLDAVVEPHIGTVAVSKLSDAWREAMMQMVEGEQRRIWIPDEMILDTDLVAIVHPPAIPADVAAPPADAITTRSGLAYKVLVPGVGDKHPSRRSKVRVHYSGWTTDGKMFDSSVVRDQPSEFPIDAVIPGWTEGLQLMYEGEKARFWIPENLAYKGKSAPYGMLVFDVELIKIQ